MGEGIKTVWEALKSNIKIRLICALTCFIAFCLIQWVIIPPASQKIVDFYLKIILVILGVLFSISILLDVCCNYLEKRQIVKRQKEFEETLLALDKDESSITHAIWSSKGHNVVLEVNAPWTVGLVNKGIIEKMDVLPEFSAPNEDKKYRYKLTKRAILTISKHVEK